MSIQKLLFAQSETGPAPWEIQPVESFNSSVKSGIPTNLYSNAANTRFGERVAISDDGKIMAVSAPGAFTGAGVVYIYNRTSGSWVLEKTLQPYAASNQNSGAGMSMSGDGEFIVIGTPYYPTLGKVNAYKRNGGAWDHVGSLVSPNQTSNDFYGISATISRDGTTVVVGANNAMRSGAGVGAIHVFRWDGAAFQFEWYYLEPVNTTARLGMCSAISDHGDVIVAGAPNYDANTGFARIFRRTAGTWSLSRQVLGSASPTKTNTGGAVAISGDGSRVVISNDTASNIGSVSIYAFNGTNYAVEQNIASYIGTVGGQFGYRVAMSQDGTRIAINARLHTKTHTEEGLIYILDKGETWSLTESFGPNPVTSQRWCDGLAMSSNGRWIAAGENSVTITNTSVGLAVAIGS